MQDALEDLRTRLLEINDLQSAAALLSWDQSTHMPPRGAPARGRQMATLGRLAHEKLTDPEVGRLLDRLEASGATDPYDSIDASLVRVTRRDFDRATKIPAGFLADMRRHGAASYQAWTRARPANDFAAVEGMLAQT
ncbi:MAG: carboxypeptidase M32, partial [Anaerolineae bacterium]